VLRSKVRYGTSSRRSLRESFPRKTPELWPDKWILDHDSASVHDALIVRKFLAKKYIAKRDHPRCSPDSDLWDFLSLSKIKQISWFPHSTRQWHAASIPRIKLSQCACKCKNIVLYGHVYVMEWNLTQKVETGT
jgi:hypothetical protein